MIEEDQTETEDSKECFCSEPKNIITIMLPNHPEENLFQRILMQRNLQWC